MSKDQKYTCIICGVESEGYGSNPDPVIDSGRCCDNCNYTVVLPKRIELLAEYKEKSSKS